VNFSLRRRIIIWYAVAIPGLVLLMALVAQQVMLAVLRVNLDDVLQLRTEDVVTVMLADLGRNRYTYADEIQFLTEQEFSSVPLILRIFAPNGTALAQYGDVPDAVRLRLDQLVQGRALEDLAQGVFDTVSIRGEESLRVYTVSVDDPETLRLLAIVQTAESLSAITAARSQLWWYSLGIGLVGGLVAMLVGVVLLQKGLAPLQAILRRVEEMGAEELGHGMPEEPRPPELQRLADSLNLMWGRIDTAFKKNQMFVATVSHELRTPLTVLEGQIDVLLMQQGQRAEDKQSLQKMSREVQRLVRLSNDLLLNAQLETAPELNLERVEMHELLEEVVGDLFVGEVDRGVNFPSQDPGVVEGDRDLLKRMALNIVDNAIKFTSDGETIEIKADRVGPWVVVSIADTGRGIPRAELARVMEPFYRANGTSHTTPGAGLGLAIVKQIVDLHKGEIEILSEEDKGTTVLVRLPAERT